MQDSSQKIPVAILGTGNIGSDLMYKILREPGAMKLVLFAGIDPQSDGLARARKEGITTDYTGIEAILARPEIRIVFDATGAKAHMAHAPRLREAGKIAIDLTPAAVGPYVVPSVDQGMFLDERNVNMITCGGQATVPMVHAVSRITPVVYAEMVSTVSSSSAGPGTRQNIDEFTDTTSRALEVRGGARQGKALIILNPAEPPILMRNTLYVVPEDDAFDAQAVFESIRSMVNEVNQYVPGYRLKSDPIVDRRATPAGMRNVVVILLEVEGAGDYLPKYAGNLDVMTSAARQTGELFARHLLKGKAAHS